jgi:RNA polymerase sigma factor (sigma-70 family)
MSRSTEAVEAPPPRAFEDGRAAPVDAIEAIYRAHAPRLQRLAAAVAGPGAASDAVQDAFALALRRRASWRGDGPLEAWVWRLVLNAARDAERKNARRRRLTVRLDRFREREAAPDAAADRALHDPLRKLPSRQRSCVVLRYYGDLSYAQIAHVMGIEVGTVGALLSKAHAALRAELEQEGPR